MALVIRAAASGAQSAVITPIKAVAVAGGWTDFETMTKCYHMPDEADVLAVTSETRKRREAHVVNTSNA